MKFRSLVFMLVAAVLVLTGCYWLPFGAVDDPFGPGPTEVVITAVPYEGCSWQWATESLPDLTIQLAGALEDEGIAFEWVTVSAYGENCLDSQGNVERFAAMETDFYIQLPVDDLDDREAVGELAADVFTVIVTTFPTDVTPGPQPGTIELEFTAGDEARVVRTQQNTAVEMVRQDVRGAALLDTLGY